MSRLKPFISVFLIVVTLLFIVFMQMEERRLGYSLLKLTREQKQITEERRQKTVLLARMTRPQQIEKWAEKKLSLKKIQTKQIIHLTGSHDSFSSRGVN